LEERVGFEQGDVLAEASNGSIEEGIEACPDSPEV
jgi:hypothetical protein